VEGRIRESRPLERAARPEEIPAARVDLGRLVPSRTSLAVGLAILVGVTLAYVIARETPLFALRSLVVRGAPPAIEHDVRVELADDLGTSLVTLDEDEVVRRLERLPTVVSARYDRDFPHSLRISIEPERPAAVLRKAAESWLVSARGRVMARLPAGAAPKLPRVWLGRSVSLVLGRVLQGELGRVAAAAGVLKASPFAGRVTTARSEAGRLTLVLRSGLELRLGRPTDLDVKLAAARAVLPTGRRDAAGSYLDVAVPERTVGHFNPQLEG
jgi:cell division septal protein FtsQ